LRIEFEGSLPFLWVTLMENDIRYVRSAIEDLAFTSRF